jgi:hypothetical protein
VRPGCGTRVVRDASRLNVWPGSDSFPTPTFRRHIGALVVNATEENFRSQCATAGRSSRIHSGSRTTAVCAKRTFARPAMSPKCQITDVLRSVSTKPDQRFLSKGEECELEVRVMREPAVVSFGESGCDAE